MHAANVGMPEERLLGPKKLEKKLIIKRPSVAARFAMVIAGADSNVCVEFRVDDEDCDVPEDEAVAGGEKRWPCC